MKGWDMVYPVDRSLILLPFEIPAQPSHSLQVGEPQSWEVEIMREKGTFSVSLILDCQST